MEWSGSIRRHCAEVYTCKERRVVLRCTKSHLFFQLLLVHAQSGDRGVEYLQRCIRDVVAEEADDAIVVLLDVGKYDYLKLDRR